MVFSATSGFGVGGGRLCHIVNLEHELIRVLDWQLHVVLSTDLLVKLWEEVDPGGARALFSTTQRDTLLFLPLDALTLVCVKP